MRANVIFILRYVDAIDFVFSNERLHPGIGSTQLGNDVDRSL
jgi:hypothetical protein